MAVTDFMEVIRTMHDKDLVAALPRLPKQQLALIRDGIDAGQLDASEIVLSALARAETPPLPPEPSRARCKVKMAKEMAKRYPRFHLYHPEDAIQEPIPEYMLRPIAHARNGSDLVGEVFHRCEQVEEPEKESFRDEIMADRIALLESNRGAR